MLSRVLPNWTVQGVVMSSTMGMCKKVKIKLPGQLGVKLWASWLDVLVVELWIILTSTLLWEVKEVFLFFLTPWRRVFNELCVGMCVWSVLWSQFFLHFVSDVQWVALKGKTSWLMFCYFLPLLCSPCFPLLIIPPPSLSLSLCSDKTVKIWSSKVWRKRWQTKWFLCRLSSAATSATDLWPALS